jgi:Leucine-rich repeat (LRR) protein
LNGLTHLVSLQINENRNLTGSVPSLAGMHALQSIDLGQNAFTGSLPSLAGLTGLQFAIFSDNQFSGTIPPFDGLASLQWFTASTNQLSGAIPSLAGLGALAGFYVDYNQLSGPPPALPSPTSLGPFGAALCPNALDHVDSADWDTITGVTPWYTDCVAAPTDNVFSDGFDGT